MEVIASRYAESLFDLAKEENKVDSYIKDIDLIFAIFNNDASFVPFFSHVLIEDAVKFDLIDKCFKGQVNEYVCNFLKLLVRKRRMRYILEIIKAFRLLCNNYLGIEEGIIYTKFDLDNMQVHEIEDAISKKQNKKVFLKVVKDESLIGGIKIEIGNQVIDASIKNKVAMLKKELLRK